MDDDISEPLAPATAYLLLDPSPATIVVTAAPRASVNNSLNRSTNVLGSIPPAARWMLLAPEPEPDVDPEPDPNPDPEPGIEGFSPGGINPCTLAAIAGPLKEPVPVPTSNVERAKRAGRVLQLIAVATFAAYNLVSDVLVWNQFRKDGKAILLYITSAVLVLVLSNNFVASLMHLPKALRNLPLIASAFVVVVSLASPEVVDVLLTLEGATTTPIWLRAAVAICGVLEDVPGLGTQLYSGITSGWTKVLIASVTGTVASILLRGLNALVTVIFQRCRASRAARLAAPYDYSLGDVLFGICDGAVKVWAVIMLGLRLDAAASAYAAATSWSVGDQVQGGAVVVLLTGAAIVTFLARCSLMVALVRSVSDAVSSRMELLTGTQLHGFVVALGTAVTPHFAFAVYRRKPFRTTMLLESGLLLVPLAWVLGNDLGWSGSNFAAHVPEAAMFVGALTWLSVLLWAEANALLHETYLFSDSKAGSTHVFTADQWVTSFFDAAAKAGCIAGCAMALAGMPFGAFHVLAIAALVATVILRVTCGLLAVLHAPGPLHGWMSSLTAVGGHALILLLCVGVTPNVAAYVYGMQPFEAEAVAEFVTVLGPAGVTLGAMLLSPGYTLSDTNVSVPFICCLVWLLLASARLSAGLRRGDIRLSDDPVLNAVEPTARLLRWLLRALALVVGLVGFCAPCARLIVAIYVMVVSDNAVAPMLAGGLQLAATLIGIATSCRLAREVTVGRRSARVCCSAFTVGLTLLREGIVAGLLMTVLSGIPAAPWAGLVFVGLGAATVAFDLIAALPACARAAGAE